jgi:hypothetical protein
MAYFAELNEHNQVLRVISVSDQFLTDADGEEQEALGAAWCHNLFGGTWIQTSYNTRAGEHTHGKQPFRKNYAGIGFTYDALRDAFIPPRPPGDHWILNEETCTWYDPLYKPIEIGVTRV